VRNRPSNNSGKLPALFRAALLCAFFFALSSCADTAARSPIIISGLSYTEGAKDNAFMFAGIAFSAYNCTDKDIASIKVSCRLYDADKKPAVYQGSNECAATFDGILAAQKSKDLCISLDSMMRSGPKENILIDFFRISSVAFTDGSSWENSLIPDYVRSY
jgi:hypothetical protein